MSAWAPERSRARRHEVPARVASLDVERAHRAGAGDAAAQAWLVVELLPGVRTIARAFLRSPADADDAVQLAMIAILRSATSYRGEASLDGWARRIAVRTVLKHLRAKRRYDASFAGDESEADEVPASTHRRSAEALPRDVHEYLDELPGAQREVIILHHALEHTLDEIAELTEASPDTVKSRLRLGLASLRKQIQQDLATGRRRSS